MLSVKIKDILFKNPILTASGTFGYGNEIGEFIDFSDSSIFDGNYAAKGTDAGPVGVLGVRILLNDEFSIGGEFRYQRGKGRVGIDEGFLGENLDLGGYATQLMFHYRF